MPVNACEKAQEDVIQCLTVLYQQVCINYTLKLGKAANSPVWKAGTVKCFTFLLEKID